VKIAAGFRCRPGGAGEPGYGWCWQGWFGGFPAVPGVRREDSGWLPAGAGVSLGREPVCKSGAGALTLTGRALCFEHAGQNFGSRPRPPGIRGVCLVVMRGKQVVAMMEPQEIEDEEYEQVLERVAAIDVA
jgi:hypothetical protein